MENRIREFRRCAGLSLEQLAENAGTTRQQIHKLETGERRLTVDWMTRLAPSLGASPADLMGPTESAASTAVPRLVGDRDLPVYGSAQGGPDGALIIDNYAIEWVKRPEPLFNVPHGFGIYVVGDSMAPAYEQGDMALIHPSRPPGRNSDIVLVRKLPDGTSAALLKRLISWSENEWQLVQYNPKLEFELTRVDWGLAYLVVGKYNRR